MCFSCLQLLFAVVVGLFFTQREEKKNPSRPKTHHRKPPENIHTDYWFDETQGRGSCDLDLRERNSTVGIRSNP